MLWKMASSKYIGNKISVCFVHLYTELGGQKSAKQDVGEMRVIV
jgi:hypothetical protein